MVLLCLYAPEAESAPRAPQAIQAALDDDPEMKMKKKAVFALSQLPKDEGVPLLIRLARIHKSPRGAEAGDVLARTVEGPAGPGVLRAGPGEA